MLAEKPTADAPTYVLTEKDTEPQPGDDEHTALYRRLLKEEFAFRDRVRREDAAYKAAQQPNKVRWPESLAELVRTINQMITSDEWPAENKWQTAADVLVDKTGKPIRAKQLNRTNSRCSYDSPIREHLRLLLLQALRTRDF